MNATENTPESADQGGIRRWFQFRLRTLCLMFVLVSVALAIFGARFYRHYQREAAIRLLAKIGGVILPDRKNGFTRVYVAGPQVTDPVLTELARHLQSFPELRELDLVNAPISDVGLREVGRLGQLEVLFVHECPVTDGGIRQLNQVIPGLVIHRTAPDPVATRLAMRKIFRHAVVAAAVSPDGSEIATGSGDGTLRKWRNTHTIAATIRSHDNWLFSVAYTSDGRTIATGGGDNLIRLWDAFSSTRIAELAGHTDDVHAVAFGHGGRTLVSAGDDRTVRVWDVASRRERYLLTGHEAAIPALKVSSRLGVIASGSRDHTIRLWSLETGNLLHELRGHALDINALALDQSETRLASASYDGTVRVWDLAGGRELATLKGHTDRVYAVAFLNDPTPDLLVSAGADSTIRVWNAQSGDIQRVVRTPRLVASLSAMPSLRVILASTAEGTLDAWDPVTGQLVSSHSTWSPDELKLAAH